jgi:hypothetical protein
MLTGLSNDGQTAEKFAAWMRVTSNSGVSDLSLLPPKTLRVDEFRLIFPVRQALQRVSRSNRGSHGQRPRYLKSLIRNYDNVVTVVVA